MLVRELNVASATVWKQANCIKFVYSAITTCCFRMKNVFGRVLILATHDEVSEWPKTNGSNCNYDSAPLFAVASEYSMNDMDACKFDANDASLLHCPVSMFFVWCAERASKLF